LAAQNLYYTASIRHPSTTSLYQVFQSFVLDCVTCTQESEIS
jgi:Na+/alanine symporter